LKPRRLALQDQREGLQPGQHRLAQPLQPRLRPPLHLFAFVVNLHSRHYIRKRVPPNIFQRDESA
jgi:hypothetical protein